MVLIYTIYPDIYDEIEIVVTLLNNLCFGEKGNVCPVLLSLIFTSTEMII